MILYYIMVVTCINVNDFVTNSNKVQVEHLHDYNSGILYIQLYIQTQNTIKLFTIFQQDNANSQPAKTHCVI